MLRRRDFIKFALAEIVFHFAGVLPSIFMPVFGQRNTDTIKVAGIGGSGCNMLDYMIKNLEMPEVEFVAIDTDERSLVRSSARRKIQIGKEITSGLGAGGNHEIGKEAALNDQDRIAQVLKGAGSVVIIAGMGGGTGTGASPVVASITKKMTIKTVALVTLPFKFEGPRRRTIAEQGIWNLQKFIINDSICEIPNDHSLLLNERHTPLRNLFLFVDDLVCKTVKRFVLT